MRRRLSIIARGSVGVEKPDDSRCPNGCVVATGVNSRGDVRLLQLLPGVSECSSVICSMVSVVVCVAICSFRRSCCCKVWSVAGGLAIVSDDEYRLEFPLANTVFDQVVVSELLDTTSHDVSSVVVSMSMSAIC